MRLDVQPRQVHSLSKISILLLSRAAEAELSVCVVQNAKAIKHGLKSDCSNSSVQAPSQSLFTRARTSGWPRDSGRPTVQRSDSTADVGLGRMDAHAKFLSMLMFVRTLRMGACSTECGSPSTSMSTPLPAWDRIVVDRASANRSGERGFGPGTRTWRRARSKSLSLMTPWPCNFPASSQQSGQESLSTPTTHRLSVASASSMRHPGKAVSRRSISLASRKLMRWSLWVSSPDIVTLVAMLPEATIDGTYLGRQ